jgi:hypothetical protein
MRQYERIWVELKKIPVKQEIAVRIHATAERRLIQAVKLEKTKDVAVKKKLELPRPGKLKIRVTEDTVKKDVSFVIVYFSLLWDGSKL